VCFIFSSENPLGKVLASCWGVDMIQLADGPKNAKVLVRHGTNIPKDFKHFYCIE
jgi:hypothetical protein